MLAVLLATSTANAFDLRLEAEARYFYNAEQAPQYSPSLAAGLEFSLPLRGEQTSLRGELFTRADREDRSRTHSDVRELFYEALGAGFEFRIGARRVFWGVAESRHLVDIINQSDFVEDLEAENKLGQPMLSLKLIRDAGALEFFLMPYQRARTYPGPNGHPHLPFPVAAEEARYESQLAQSHLDWATRWQQSFSGLDYGLSVFNGTAREPRILPCLRRGSGFRGTEERANCDIASGIQTPTSPLPEELTPILQALGLAPSDEAARAEITRQVLANLVLVPAYDRLRQISLDAQYVWDNFAFKLEALRRESRGVYSTATVAGVEWSLGDPFGFGWDLSLLTEHLSDSALNAARYDDDWFAATRIGFNDAAGSQILAGAVADHSGNDRFYQIEASRRLGDDWKLSGKFRAFEKIPVDSPTLFLDQEDLFSLTLERFW